MGLRSSAGSGHPGEGALIYSRLILLTELGVRCLLTKACDPDIGCCGLSLSSGLTVLRLQLQREEILVKCGIKI